MDPVKICRKGEREERGRCKLNYSVRVRCPYYETMASDTKKQATITCQNICCNLGFEIKNQIVFTCHEEKSNFAGIFCEDMYETCPYFKGIYKTQMEDEKK